MGRKGRTRKDDWPGESAGISPIQPGGGINWGIKRAISKGWLIVEPNLNELQIDLDGARALRRYGMQFSILRKAGLTIGWREKISNSRKAGHVHVTITMGGRGAKLAPTTGKNNRSLLKRSGWKPRRPPSLVERICLQAILGSDLKREAFNYARAKRGNKYPVVFFEKAQHAV